MSFGGDLSSFGKNLKGTLISGPVDAAKGFANGLPGAIRGAPAAIGNTILGQVSKGVNDFFSSPSLRDYRHAANIFGANSYSKAPKLKHLFHVSFGINQQLMNALSPSTNLPTNYGLYVKSIDLPKFQSMLTEMNQYNRKRFVQTKVNYDPVKIQFHDDGENAINRLWFAYFTYYFYDSINHVSASNAGMANDSSLRNFSQRNTYNNDNGADERWGYNGEKDTAVQTASGSEILGKLPFFNHISIYSLNQKTYTEYRLMNPIIESFGHDQHDYASGNGVMEHSMTLRFESVQYYSGLIGSAGQIVPGFGAVSEGYDNTTSPLKTPGSSKSIDGDGGLIDSFNSLDFSKNPLESIKTLARTANQFKNPSDLINAGIQFGKDNSGSVVNSATDSLRKINFKFPFGGSQ